MDSLRAHMVAAESGFMDFTNGAINVAEKGLRVVRIGLQALVLQQKYYNWQPLDPEEEKFPDNRNWQTLGPDHISAAFDITASVSRGVFTLISLAEFASRTILPAIAVVAGPLIYIAPVFGVATLLTHSYQTYQELMADDSVVPQKAKLLSGMIWVAMFASVVFSTVALFFPVISPGALPLSVVLFAICIGLAYLKHQMILEVARPQTIKTDIVE